MPTHGNLEKGNEADGTRTRNHRIDSPPVESSKSCSDKEIREAGQYAAAPIAAHDIESIDDPDLASVISSWDHLPEAIRAGFMAMVRTVLVSD